MALLTVERGAEIGECRPVAWRGGKGGVAGCFGGCVIRFYVQDGGEIAPGFGVCGVGSGETAIAVLRRGEPAAAYVLCRLGEFGEAGQARYSIWSLSSGGSSLVGGSGAGGLWGGGMGRDGSG